MVLNLSFLSKTTKKLGGQMKILLGADAYGFQLKEAIKQHLLDRELEVEDVGISDRETETPYYQIASEVAKGVGNNEADRGILVCGTSMGMSIIANKHPNVYAAVCENSYAAQKSRSINNSNILTLGGWLTTPQIGKEIVDIWLKTEFASEWESPIQEWLHNSIKEISQIEQKQFGKKK